MIEVVYQHADFYIVVKPNGVNFHDDQGLIVKNSAIEAKLTSEEDRNLGFFNQCCQYFNEVLYPLHRLDKVTSGLMILGRNKAAAQWFQHAFEQKRIEKTYIALSNSKPKKKQGLILGDMAKARGSQWKLMKTKANPAKTRFFSYGIEDSHYSRLRLFVLAPETGKTHQLRVALKSISAPILGDDLYNGDDSDRVYLHAYSLRFEYENEPLQFSTRPKTGECFVTHQKIIEQHVHSATNTQNK